MNIDNGKLPAFPALDHAVFSGKDGLTKREWFAGMALMAFEKILNTDGYAVSVRCNAESVAKKCVEQADAIIAELSKDVADDCSGECSRYRHR